MNPNRPPVDRNNRSRATFGRRLLQLTIGLTSLAGMCMVLSAVLPERRLPEITNKMTYFRRHAVEFDTLFIGSSRFYHGISPKVFDATAVAAGRATHSFNLGIDDMKPPESLETLEKVLRVHPVQTIFLELCRLQIDPHAPDQTTERDAAWHRWRWTEAVLREIPGGRNLGLYSRHARWRGLFQVHLGLWLQNFVNLGRGQIWTVPGEPVSQGMRELGPDGDGFAPRPAIPWTDAHDFTKLVGQIHRGEVELEWTDDPQLLRLMEEVAGECERHGSQLILVIPPTLSSMPRPLDKVPTLAYNDPRKYPELFSAAEHSDWEHLAEQGAMRFSQALARDYAQMSESRK